MAAQASQQQPGSLLALDLAASLFPGIPLAHGSAAGPTAAGCGWLFGDGQAAGTASAADDEAATARTIAQMQAMSEEDAIDPAVQSLARRLGSPAAAFRWLQRHVEFREDRSNNDFALGVLTSEQELLIRPRVLISDTSPGGDCDEFSMAFAALALALGLRPSFVTVAANPLTASYSHVYVTLGGLAYDASHGRYPGWVARPGAITRFGDRVGWTGKRRDWGAPSFGRMARLQGLGSTLRETLIDQIPGLVETGREVLVRRGTPAGYYRSTTGGVETRVASGLDAFSLSPLVGGSSFPWEWLGLAAVGVLLLRAAVPGRKGVRS